MNDIKIFTMSLSDFYEIEPIYNAEFDDFWKTSILKAELENTNSKYIIAKLDQEIVGYAGIWISVDDIHITNIAVKKSYRNNGIGSALLEQLISMSKKLNKSSLTLEVNTKNLYAQKLYLKFGFKNLGLRKKYYNGVEDAYIMTLYFN